MILPLLFCATIFLSAGLLFSVQPIIAKMLLPLLGGTPAVWTTCMVFFQAVLLAGYAYAHFISSRLKPRAQSAVHLSLLCIAGLTLPFGISEVTTRALAEHSNPAGWLLMRLAETVGLSFLAISATAPLLQKWFSRTRHASANDPYFLYAASNLGSLLALLSYPVLLEPHLRLAAQSRLWTSGFAALGVLLILCAATQWRSRAISHPNDGPDRAQKPDIAGAETDFRISTRHRFRWVALAFVPSSLMLGATTYLTTDIASIPLLWILPLALYLTTFVLAFARKAFISQRLLHKALPMGAVGLIYLILSEATDPVWVLIGLHLLFLFIAALVCHGRLASDRPPSSQLTEFYLCLSLGGVLGGLFNALIAPNIFVQVAEYPVAIILACLLKPDEPRPNTARSRRVTDLIWPIVLGLAVIALAVWIPHVGELPVQLRLALIFGVPLILAYTLVDRSFRFSLGLAAILLASAFYAGGHGRTLHASRNFFGVLRVTLDPDGAFRRMVHGNTIHGRQFIDPARSAEPLSYYHRTGPLGQVFKIFDAKTASTNVAVVGLGAGSMACYAKPHQRWTFYEINPDVIRVAQDTNYFSFLSQAKAARLQMTLGDARLRLREAPDNAYDFILLDAFSSDAIPMHLITREAIALYLSKLAEGGLLAFHISNRCLALEPILGDLAGSAGLACYAQDEIDPSSTESLDGKDQSHWIVMVRDVQDLGRLTKDSRWQPVKPRPQTQIWTDDFSNLWSVFNWK